MTTPSKKDEREDYLLVNSHPQPLEYQKTSSKHASFHETNVRWLVLFFATVLLFGDYSCYDNPQALQEPLQHGNLKLTYKQFNLLYTVYSIPNVFLPFFGGIIVDKLGVRVGIFIFSTILLAGQFIWMLGGVYEYYPLMVLGRVIFGIGGEVLVVAQNTLIFKWFRNKELSFAFGFTVSMNNFSGTVNASLMPFLFSINQTFFLPLFVGFVFCFVSWICGLIAIHYDRESDRRDDIKRLEQASSFIKLEDVRTFPFVFWILCMICFFVSGGFYIFLGNANQMIVSLFHQTPSNAGLYLMILYSIIALITPFFGKFIDHYNKRAYTLVVASILMSLSLLYLLILPPGAPITTVIPMLLLLGIGVGIYASTFWTSIPLIVGEDKEGSALGIIVSLQNLNLILSSVLFGTISDKTLEHSQGFYWGIFYLFAQFILSLLLALILNFSDSRTGGTLNKTPQAKQVL